MLDKNDSAKWLIKIADCNSNSFTTVSSITQYSIVSNSVATFIAINFMDLYYTFDNLFWWLNPLTYLDFASSFFTKYLVRLFYSGLSYF